MPGHAPHGALCAALLPASLELNYERAKLDGLDGTLSRMQHAAESITGKADVDELVSWVKDACTELEIPGLSTYGFTTDMTDPMVQASKSSSSMRGNPAALTDNELAELLQRSM